MSENRTAGGTTTASGDGPETGGTEEWIDRIRASVRTVAGKGITDVTDLWNDFRDSTAVRVTVYGPYDAGKSSLVTRLLEEDGTAVPSWLTIGARPETFVVGRETSAGLEYADTPGNSAGRPEHEAAADSALGVTDALLVVLPPQLATTDVEHIRAVATGTLFGPKGSRLFPAGALLLTVGRMDEASIDPQYNPDAHRRLCARKRDELAALLAHGTAGGCRPACRCASSPPTPTDSACSTGRPRAGTASPGSALIWPPSWTGVRGCAAPPRCACGAGSRHMC